MTWRPPSVLAGRWPVAGAFPMQPVLTRIMNAPARPLGSGRIDQPEEHKPRFLCAGAAPRQNPFHRFHRQTTRRHQGITRSCGKNVAFKNGSAAGGGWTFGGAMVRVASSSGSGWWCGGARGGYAGQVTYERPMARLPLEDAMTSRRQILAAGSPVKIAPAGRVKFIALRGSRWRKQTPRRPRQTQDH